MKKNISITINRETMKIVAPVIVICVVLIAGNKPGPLLLFLIGIFAGILVQRSFK